MKLRNKKTGEIVKLVGYVKTGDDRMFFRFEDDKGTYKKEYNSLTKLNEEWEDYKPKEYWYSLDTRGEVCEWSMECFSKETKDEMKAIGNYFETKEEAEKAVEKLKAWKRLKDKNFRFEGYTALGVGEIKFCVEFEDMNDEGEIGELQSDLDLLFGGNDESSN